MTRRGVETLERVVEARGASVGGELNRQRLALPESLQAELVGELGRWYRRGSVDRLWDGDETLWTDGDESDWLGWLELPAAILDDAELLPRLADVVARVESEVFDAGPADGGEDGEHGEDGDEAPPADAVVLLGMGGSSLGPEVMSQVLARSRALHVLDSTDPAQIRTVRDAVRPDRTLFIVSSKSGTTLETDLLCDFFHDFVSTTLGPEAAGRRFVAVTDPGSALEEKAERLGFRAVFHGEPSVGGRYSVLSAFGLVPAACVGQDVERLLELTIPMVQACLADGAGPGENPGLSLGLAMGLAARAGRDKVTLVCGPQLAGFGSWVEQLLAESTGKRGVGVVPVDLERLGEPDVYGADRFFVSLELEPVDGSEDAAVDADQMEETAARLAALEAAGHPVVRIRLTDEYAIGQEFFRWEFATAVAGAVLGVDPFDQPDVEAAKRRSAELVEAFESGTGDVEPEPLAEGAAIRLYAEAGHRAALLRPDGGELSDLLANHLACVGEGDYLALLAYVERSADILDLLQAMRHKVRNQLRVATCLGFGPRYLHSTGQAHKGGPDSGVFLVLTRSHRDDLPVPGRDLTFGQVLTAQALGDAAVLAERGRRVLRVHFTGKLVAGLQRLDGLVGRSLQALAEAREEDDPDREPSEE